MRAALYARVSSAQQRDAHTIASQLRLLPEFAARRGWTVVGTFVDDGKSASKRLERRADLSRLLGEAAAGNVDVVVVMDYDRFTRTLNIAERGALIGALQVADVKLAIAATGEVHDLNTDTGDLMVTLGMQRSASWVRQHVEKTRRGHDEAVAKNRKPRGQTPVGYFYDKNNKTIVIDETWAPLVRELFRRVAAGESARTVGNDLEQRGHRMPRGGRWGAVAHRLIREEYYRGEWLVDRARGLRISIPPLVDDATWYAANASLSEGAHRGLKRTKYTYLAAGRLVCGVCGGKVGVHGPTVSHGWRGSYYRCINKRWPVAGQPRCTLPMIQTKILDARVWDALVGLLERPDLAELLAEQLAAGDAVPWDQDAEEARRRLAELQRAEEALLDRFTRGQIGEAAMDAQLAKIGARRRFLERQAAKADVASQEARRAARAAAGAAETIAALRGGLAATTPEERRELVQALVPGGAHVITVGADKGLKIQALLTPLSGATRIGERIARDHGEEGLSIRVVA